MRDPPDNIPTFSLSHLHAGPIHRHQPRIFSLSHTSSLWPNQAPRRWLKSGRSPPPPLEPDSTHPQHPRSVPARSVPLPGWNQPNFGLPLSSTSGLPQRPRTSKTELGEQLEHLHPFSCSSPSHPLLMHRRPEQPCLLAVMHDAGRFRPAMPHDALVIRFISSCCSW